MAKRRRVMKLYGPEIRCSAPSEEESRRMLVTDHERRKEELKDKIKTLEKRVKELEPLVEENRKLKAKNKKFRARYKELAAEIARGICRKMETRTNNANKRLLGTINPKPSRKN